MSLALWARRTGLALAACAAAAAGALVTPAHAAPAAHFLQVAWGQTPLWRPLDYMWVGTGQAITVHLDDRPGLPNAPGVPARLRLAVRSTFEAPVTLTLTALDPDPMGNLTVAPDRFAELFGQIQVKVTENGQPVADGPATALNQVPVPGALPAKAAGYRVFDIEFRLRDGVDNRWLQATTGFTLVVQAAGEASPPAQVPTGTAAAGPDERRFQLAVFGLGAITALALLAARCRRRQEESHDNS